MVFSLNQSSRSQTKAAVFAENHNQAETEKSNPHICKPYRILLYTILATVCCWFPYQFIHVSRRGYVLLCQSLAVIYKKNRKIILRHLIPRTMIILTVI
jgi:hypothetical protein